MNRNADASYKQAYDQFLEKLKECHEARGTPFVKVPTFGGQPLDLYALYNTVTSFGGISVVTDRRKWDQVFIALGFPPCLNAAYALRQHYCRYLEAYEKIYFFNEEADETATPIDTPRSYAQMMKYRRINKPPKISTIGEPLVQNFNRIMFSLQSGLPNEIDFALNICSLLSNVSNSIFNLAKCPQVLSLMLGHVGILCNDNTYVKELCIDWHSSKTERNFQKFWALLLTETSTWDIFKDYLKEICLLQIPLMDEKTTKLFADEKEHKQFEANKSPEFCRVNQISIIVCNFSFETINSIFLASHDGAKRFLMLCSSCKHNSIQRNGLDALDNIAEHVILDGKEDGFTQCFLKLLDKFLKSENKIQRVRGMSILAKLASRECNKGVLVEMLSDDSFKSLMQTLYLPDICLLLSALDALYFLSALCTETSDCILNVHASMDILLSLCTVRAESFGNQAIQGYRIVENKLSIFTPKNQMWLKSQEHKRNMMMISQPKTHYMDPNILRPQMLIRPGMPSVPRPNVMPPFHGRSMHPQVGPYGVPYFPRMPPSPRHPSAARFPHQPELYGLPPRFPPKQLGIPLDPKAQMMAAQSRPPVPPAMPLSGAHLHSQRPPDSDMVELDSDVYTAHWMSGFYEPHPTNELKASFIYRDYVTVCKELKRDGILTKDQFIMMLRRILPPHLVIFHEPDSEGEILLSGIQRRMMPVQVHSRIPRSVYQEIMRNKQNHLPAAPNNPAPSNVPATDKGHNFASKNIGETTNEPNKESVTSLLFNGSSSSEKPNTPKDAVATDVLGAAIPSDGVGGTSTIAISKPSMTPTDMYAAIIGDNKLSNSAECQIVIDKVKSEVQNHYMQFYAERKNLQFTQMQIHQIVQQQQQPSQQPSQPQLPPQIIQDFQQRIQSHHQQMQSHYQRLQQLNTLLEEVQSKLKHFEGSINDNKNTTENIPTSSIAFPTASSCTMPMFHSPSSRLPLTPPSNGGSHHQSSLQIPFQPGQSFMVPPPSHHTPQEYMVPIQHGIPAVTVPLTTPHRDKGNREGKASKKDQLDSSESDRGSRRGKARKGDRGAKHQTNSPLNMVNLVSVGNPNVIILPPVLPQQQQQQEIFDTTFRKKSPISSPNAPLKQPLTKTHPGLMQNINNVASTSAVLRNPFGQLHLNETLSSAYKNTLHKELKIAIADKNSNASSKPSELSTTVASKEEPVATTVSSTESPVSNITTTTAETTLTASSIDQPSLNGLSSITTVQASVNSISETNNHNNSNNETRVNNKPIDGHITGNGIIEENKTHHTFSDSRQLHNPSNTSNTKKTNHSSNQLNGHISNKQNELHEMVNGDSNNKENKQSSILAEHSNGDASREEKEGLKPVVKINGDHRVDYSMTNGDTEIHLKRKNAVRDTIDKKQRFDDSESTLLDETCSNGKNGSVDQAEVEIGNLPSPEESSSKSLEALQRLVSERTGQLDKPTKPVFDQIESEQEAMKSKNAVIIERKLETETISDRIAMDEKNIPKKLHLELDKSSHITLHSTNNNDDGATNIDLLRKQLSSISSAASAAESRAASCAAQSLAESHAPSIKQEGDRCFAVLHNKQDASNSVFPCQWEHCTTKPFLTASELLNHMVENHTPEEDRMSRCKVKHCSSSQNPRGALICHFKEKHCSPADVNDIEKALDFQVEDESPVTRSVRYTAALILRNLIRNASLGKEILSNYESTLATIAMSKSEATSAAVDCLFELNLVPQNFSEELEEDEDNEDASETEDEFEDYLSHTTTQSEEEREQVKVTEDVRVQMMEIS